MNKNRINEIRDHYVKREFHPCVFELIAEVERLQRLLEEDTPTREEAVTEFGMRGLNP